MMRRGVTPLPRLTLPRALQAARLPEPAAHLTGRPAACAHQATQPLMCLRHLAALLSGRASVRVRRRGRQQQTAAHRPRQAGHAGRRRRQARQRSCGSPRCCSAGPAPTRAEAQQPCQAEQRHPGEGAASRGRPGCRASSGGSSKDACRQRRQQQLRPTVAACLVAGAHQRRAAGMLAAAPAFNRCQTAVFIPPVRARDEACRLMKSRTVLPVPKRHGTWAAVVAKF